MSRRFTTLGFGVAATIGLLLFQNFTSTSGYDFTKHRGLYAFYMQPNGATNQSRIDELQGAIKKSTIDGLTIQIGWEALEDSPGHFIWTEFDRLVETAVLNHKKIGLGVGGGAKAPDWLAAPPYSVPTINLIWDKTSGRGTGDPSQDCYQKNFPLPWNATYKSRYIKMMTAVRDHLQSMTFPGFPANSAMNAVTYIKLAGINVTSSEFMIPRDEAADIEVCNSSNDAKWVTAGYTFNRIVSAAQQMADGIAPLFPNRVLVLSVISNGAFPRFDSNGRDTYPDGPSPGTAAISNYDLITKAFIDYGKKTYGSRLSLQWNALSSQPSGSMDQLLALASGGKVGWQLNQRGDKGSGYNTDLSDSQKFLPVCDSTTKLCHVPEYQYMLGIGIEQYKAELLELHVFDVNLIEQSALAPAQSAIQN